MPLLPDSWSRVNCMLGLLVSALFIVPAAYGAEGATSPTWQEDFEKGITAARPYYKDGTTASLEATGDGTILATLPGERALEGFHVSATDLPANRRFTVKARVRGKGDLLLALHSGSGWLYAPVHTLTDDWQVLTAGKTTGPRETTLSIFFLSASKKQPGAVFEVDDVQVFADAPLEVADVEVPPRKFEAEAFAVQIDSVTNDESASAGRCVSDGRSLRLEGLPFPRTSRLVSVYVRVRTGAKKSRLTLVSRRCGQGQTLRSVSLMSSPDWQWVCLPAVSAEEVGDATILTGRVDEAGSAPLAFDCVVLSTDAELDAAALDDVAATVPKGPMVCVVKTSEAPVVDGKAEDPCWKCAVSVMDFLAYNTFTPLAEPTGVRFLYDATHLYVLVVAQESVLDVAAQRRHEIRAKATDRDGKVLRDDSCMVLLSPEGSEEGYEFSVNTLGTLVDARCRMNDLWSTRNISWNADVDVAVRQEDGYWVAELAIPLADLGVSLPIAGQEWKAIVARIGQTRGELGTWNHSLAGAHRPETTGMLVFGESSVGLVPVKPLRTLEIGRDALDVALHANRKESDRPDAGVTLWSQIASPDKKATRDVTHVPVGSAKATHPIVVQESGPATVNWMAMDAATLEPLYVSPTIYTSVRSSQATLTLSTDGAYRVVVNDQPVASGASAAGTSVRVPLREGANVIAVEAATGVASLKLAGPVESQTPIRWRMNVATAKDALSAKLDDRTWRLAEPVEQASDSEPMLGQAGTPTVFRHMLLVRHTRIWPKPEPAFCIAGNGMQNINFTAMGLVGKRLMDWEVCVAVPKGYEVVGSTGFYGKNVETQPLFQWEPAGKVTIDGEQMQLHRVRADKPVRSGRHQIMSQFQLMVRIADPKLVPPGSRSTWHYWTQANDGSMTEPRSSFAVEALPPLAGKQPKEFVMQLWGSISRMDEDDLREPLLATIKAAGFNEFVTNDRWSSEHGDGYGLRTQMLLSFQSWSIDVRAHLEQHPEDRLIDQQGEPSSTLMCLTQLLGEGRAVVDEQIAKELEESGAAIAQYDYEFSPMAGPHSCYCDRCLAAFRSHAKLPSDVTLTPETIQADHADDWVDFMAWRVAKLLGQMKDSVHLARPGTKFSVYSGYHLPDNAARYGIDWGYVGQTKATDIIGCGYGRPVPAIHDTVVAADGLPAIFGVLITPYKLTLDQPVTRASKARILRRAIDSTGGVLVYERRSMDGRWWFAVAEVSRLIACYEELFLRVRPEAIEGQDPAAVQLLRGKDASLVCVMNGGSKPRAFELTLPADLGDGKEFYSDESVSVGEMMKVSLPPGEVAVYVFGAGG
jgi:hypothetical protein